MIHPTILISLTSAAVTVIVHAGLSSTNQTSQLPFRQSPLLPLHPPIRMIVVMTSSMVSSASSVMSSASTRMSKLPIKFLFYLQSLNLLPQHLQISYFNCQGLLQSCVSDVRARAVTCHNVIAMLVVSSLVYSLVSGTSHSPVPPGNNSSPTIRHIDERKLINNSVFTMNYEITWTIFWWEQDGKCSNIWFVVLWSLSEYFTT